MVDIDVIFCAHGRPEFTRASFKAFCKNTPHVSPDTFFGIYTDGEDPLPEIQQFAELHGDGQVVIERQRFGGPVACMNHFIQDTSGEFIAKVDNDLIVCPGWLDACLDVMRRYPSVGALGLESWNKDPRLFPEWLDPTAEPSRISIRPSTHVGGIGLFRRSIFDAWGLPKPNPRDGRYGWTEHQWSSGFIKAWMFPPLPVFLLDHIPRSPWKELSERYEAQGHQRASWGPYPEFCCPLWKWWTKE